MSNQQTNSELLKTKLIEDDLTEAKTSVTNATKRPPIVFVSETKKEKKISDDENTSIPFYNELHYGNYE